MNLADRMVVIAGGRIEAEGTKDEIYPSLLKESSSDVCAFRKGDRE
jgi:ABC-type Fe3+/spermidine/putrescine transport system ATPase subunit